MGNQDLVSYISWWLIFLIPISFQIWSMELVSWGIKIYTDQQAVLDQSTILTSMMYEIELW